MSVLTGPDDLPVDDPEFTPLATRVVGALAWIIGLVALLSWRPWMFVFVVGVLLSIMLHELGHFVTARRSGMKVTQFFLGFGPRVWSIHRNGVEYGMRALPLGGFVKIIGMTAMDEVDPADEAVTYRRASFPKRLLVITAGSLTHVVVALVTIVGVYTFAGRVQESGRITILSVSPGSPAAAAGLRPGDSVLAIDRSPVPTEDLFRTTLGSRQPGSFVLLTVQRGGETFDLGATLVQSPYAAKGEVRGFLGVGSDSVQRMPISVGQALVHGPRDLVSGLGQAVVGITRVVNPVNVFGHLTGSNTDVSSRPTTMHGRSASPPGVPGAKSSASISSRVNGRPARRVVTAQNATSSRSLLRCHARSLSIARRAAFEARDGGDSCAPGASCATQGPRHLGVITCASGHPTCTDSFVSLPKPLHSGQSCLRRRSPLQRGQKNTVCGRPRRSLR